MQICQTCGKKFIRADYYEKHLTTHKAPEEPVVEEAQPKPEVAPEPVTQEPEKIILRFNREVEVTINGVRYAGMTVEAPTFETASEIVRIAREAYGPHILEV